jgi:hypothetical protein
VLITGLVAVLGVAAGSLGTLWWTRHRSKARRRIPAIWPLDERAIMNSAERKVWDFLRQAFRGHHVMVKLPLTRFTTPRAGQDPTRWYELLSDVYCTFAVCSQDGKVIGCIDVNGPQGISKSNRLLKLSLLFQCGISYRVVNPQELPRVSELLEEFLGSRDVVFSPGSFTPAPALQARQTLKAVIERQRRQREDDRPVGDRPPVAKEPAAPAAEGFAASGLNPSAWQQPDSFITPLDSRAAALT